MYPFLTCACILRGGNYEAPLYSLVKLQNKAVRIINSVPLHVHITPHYVVLGLMKLTDIIKLNACEMFYDHIVAKKHNIFHCPVSALHYYVTRSTSFVHLNPGLFGIII